MEETEKTATELASPAAAAALQAAKAQARTDRILKLAAVQGERTAVAYWGGTLRVVDAGGKIVSEQQLPQDVTALAWSGPNLIAGLADGRVLALKAK